MTRFAGKSVLVTGAGSGIGRATTHLFAAEGAWVIAMDVTHGVDETASSAKGDVTPLRGDAGTEADIQRMIAHAMEMFGGLDIIVANAGISGGFAGIFEQSEADFTEILRVNLLGPFLAIKHGAAVMLERGGAIVCTASVAGLRAGAGGPAYSASKAGVINLVQMAAQQLTGSGVRVNAVCPGLIETGMTQPIYDQARARGHADKIGAMTPLQRGGEPDEIATAIAFLASDDASYITGHALVVDGGLSSSLPFPRPRKTGGPANF